MACPHSVFCHTAHHVLTEFVVAVQENVDFHHHQRLRRDVFRRWHLILTLIVLFYMFLAIGVLENLCHHVRILAIGMSHQRLPFGKGHVESRLSAVFRQTGDYQDVALLVIIVYDNCYIIVCLREVILVDEALSLVSVPPGNNLIRQFLFWLDGLQGLHQIGRVSIEGLCHRIVIQIRIDTEVAGALQPRIQLVDGHSELRIIHHTGFFVEIKVKQADIFFRIRQATTEEFTSAHYLHASSARTDKCQKRLRHHGGSLTDGNGLIIACKVINLQQHQTCVCFADTLAISILHHRGKAYTGHFVGEVAGTGDSAVVEAFQFHI